MARAGSLTIEQLKTLCDFDGTTYISKQGDEYINALSNVFTLENNNDKPFTREDVVNEPKLNDFNFSGKDDFIFICNLKARPMTISTENARKNEKIIASDFASTDAEAIYKNALGVAYMITCEIEGEEHIIKFGQTRTTFEKRLTSYNCGVAFNWRTASTTNIKMLQSMLATRLTYKLYLYDCSQDLYQITWHDIASVQFATPKSLAVEDIMVNQFINQFGKKPLANIQASATTVD